MKSKRQVLLLADLGFGDSGKGTFVDYLTKELNAHTIVRYNGGAQAAHNVVDSYGRAHTFSQFGSTFFPTTRTHLSQFMLVNPFTMLKEEEHLQRLHIRNTFGRTTIDYRALITTPYQMITNRLKELSRESRHGSCGMGIGETMADYLEHTDQVLFAEDLKSQEIMRRKLKFLRDLKISQLQDVLPLVRNNPLAEKDIRNLFDPDLIDSIIDTYTYFTHLVKIVDETYLQTVLKQDGAVIFEGAQGVLLDEWYGFHPYTTWSTTTFKNANAILQSSQYDGEVTKLGVIRTYMTRHGAGPFVTEDTFLTKAVQDKHNENNQWQQTFRVGYLDIIALRYALNVIGSIDYLLVSHLDRLHEFKDWGLVTGYFYIGEERDLDKYFVVDEHNSITDINKSGSPDLVYQEELTKRLFNCVPVYEPVFSKDIFYYLRRIEELLEVSIGVVSAGMTDRDKTSRRSFEQRIDLKNQ